MQEQLKSNKAIRFLVFAAVLYIAWLVIYFLVIKPYTSWDYYLNYSIVESSHYLFSFLGIETHIDIESEHVLLLLDGGNYRGIWVGDECNGFKLFSIFSIFIIAFPAVLKHKIWFIPLGLILIHLANIFRIMALVMINNYYPRYLDFNHLYTFTIFVYAIIFLLWFIFAKKYAQNEK